MPQDYLQCNMRSLLSTASCTKVADYELRRVCLCAIISCKQDISKANV